MRYALIALALVATPVAAQERPVLTVYTYDSFITEWGPGPLVETAFEAICECDLRFVAAGDGAELISRLRLEGEQTEADIVLGLDSNLMAAAAETGLFTNHALGEVDYDLPVVWDDPMFVPYDWGYFAFVYDKTRLPEPPASFEALAASDVSIVIQDPRASTPGLGLLLWVKAAYPDRAGEIWEALADNILTVTPGWTEAYALFTEGEADMVLSYTTSPAYHLIAESDDGKAAASFTEGHYLQVEVAARLASTDEPDLADRFLAFMVSEEFQKVIPETNWMYPAVTPPGGLPAGFDTLITPERALIYPASEAALIRDEALAEWQTALSR